MKQRTKKERDTVVQSYLKSGVSCAKFSRMHNLNPNTLYRWLKQYREKPDELETFIEITPPRYEHDNKQNKYIEIRTKSTRIQIPVSIDNDQLAFLFNLMGLSHVS